MTPTNVKYYYYYYYNYIAAVTGCFILLTLLVRPSLASPIHQNDGRCDHIRQRLQSYITTRENASNIRDICPFTTTSCCAGLEAAIENKARFTFVSQLKSRLSAFRRDFDFKQNYIRRRLMQVLNETVDVRLMNAAERSFLHNAANKLVEFMRQEINTHHFHSANKPDQRSSVESNLHHLYSAIVIDQLRLRMIKLVPEYLECLKFINFREVDIFSEIHDQLSTSIRQAIESARLIQQSLDHSSRLLDQAEQLQLSEYCIRQLASNLHCGECHEPNSVVGKPPCASVCQATIASCFDSTHLGLINKTWISLTNSFSQLVDSAVSQHNPETILLSPSLETSFPNLLAKAIKMAEEKSEQIDQKVTLHCGRVRYYRSAIPIESNIDYKEQQQYSTFSPSLYVSLDSMKHLLKSHETIFDNMPNILCQSHPQDSCRDNQHLPSSASFITQPKTSKHHPIDDLVESVGRFNGAVNRFEENRLSLSNNTFYSYESSENGLTIEGSGSGHSPDDTEPDDSDVEQGSGESTEDSTPSPTIVKDPIITDYTKPTTSNDRTQTVTDTGSFATSLQCNSVFIVLLLFVPLFAHISNQM